MKQAQIASCCCNTQSRPPARTRGLKLYTLDVKMSEMLSRPPARTRGLKQSRRSRLLERNVASSREDAWIETRRIRRIRSRPMSRPPARTRGLKQGVGGENRRHDVASSREDAWIETDKRGIGRYPEKSRPPARTRGLKHSQEKLKKP